MAHPHGMLPQFMETVKHMRLQVHSVMPAGEDVRGSVESKHVGHSLQLGRGRRKDVCTVVLSTAADKSCSTQLIMGSQVPQHAEDLTCTKQDLTALTIAVYQADTRIAHAIIPLEQVWQVRTSLPVCVHKYRADLTGLAAAGGFCCTLALAAVQHAPV